MNSKKFVNLLAVMLGIVGVRTVGARSNLTELYDNLFMEVLIFGLIVFILVLVLWIYVVYKFRDSAVDEAKGVEGTHLLKLQRIWIAVPILIGVLLLALSLPALGEFQQELNNPVADKEVIVEATPTWKWIFYYEGQKFSPVEDDIGISTTTLVLEAGLTYKFILYSSGPLIHSFYVYELNFKMDVVPQKNNTITVTIEEPGEYQLLCAEYCGAQHSMMRGVIKAVAP